MTRRDSRRPSVDEARPRVLFVDDERHVQRAFEQAAFSLGVVVELANSATQALRAVERSRFDVIAVDLSMPGLDGLGGSSLGSLLPPPLGRPEWGPSSATICARS